MNASRFLSVVVAALLAAVPASFAETVLVVDDPVVTAELEAAGYGFERLFGAQGASDLATLYAERPAYRTIADTIGEDIAALRAQMKEGGRPLKEVTGDNTGRVLDMRWLKTEAARFRLVGVVNRLDRRDFHGLRGERGCGEARLIYRLAYAFNRQGRLLASRMPFGFNAVYDVPAGPDGSCVEAVRLWQAPEGGVTAGWLAAGPLDRSLMRFRQLELNGQVVRLPSGPEGGFGGQAAYLMRIYGISGDAVAELPLENTPDAEAIAADEALRAQLVAYVRDNVAAVDEGVYLLPETLSARRVITWSTFGSLRHGNRAYRGLIGPDDLAGLDLSAARLARAPQALIERLDNGACQGCHQAGSTAGFHFIGLDDDTTSPLNRIEVGISPHLHAELPRRAAYADAVASGGEPDRFRPLSAAPPADWTGEGPDYRPAEIGMACVMPGEADDFAGTWQCGAGTACTPLATYKGEEGRTFAQCLLPPDSEAMFSGHPCLAGEIDAGEDQPFNDRFRISSQFTAFAKDISRTDYTCRPPRIGVPGGIAYRNCNEADRRFTSFKPGEPMPNEICGLVGGKKFDLCVATNNFDQCLGGAVNRGNRQACSADRFCREDYMCQSLPPDTPGIDKVEGVGFCSPTYFVFQMRVDNHTTPWQAGRGRSAGIRIHDWRGEVEPQPEDE